MCKISRITFINMYIKTHGNESQGQEEAASAHPSILRGHYSE